ncbi:MAG: hypothetical protein LUH36_07815 [Oscillospiraceae bacterium]|nr:hypothetical protein [Oscillospiraceae bacterium]
MEAIKYMRSLLTFYLKGEISFDKNFVNLKIPNTILGLIPLGSKNKNLAIDLIVSVGSDFKLVFKSFIVGVIIALIGVSSFENSFLLGLILLIIGAGMVISSFQTNLTIQTAAGETLHVPFLIFEKSKAAEAEKNIRALKNERLNDTNNRSVTEKQTETLVDSINSLKR